MELDIRLKRSNKVYTEGVCFKNDNDVLFYLNFEFFFLNQESLIGVIVIDSKSDSKHEGISLSVDATVQMQLSTKNVGIFEAFYNSAKVYQKSSCLLIKINSFFSLNYKANHIDQSIC